MSHEMNRTELIELLREDGLGNVSRANKMDLLEIALDTDVDLEQCPLEERRASMQRHIKRNWRRIRTQLPRCNGKCETFGCPDAIVIGCWFRFKDEIL
jgi:hypothetical protein